MTAKVSLNRLTKKDWQIQLNYWRYDDKTDLLLCCDGYQVHRSSDEERCQTFRLSQNLISQLEEMKAFHEQNSQHPVEGSCPDVEAFSVGTSCSDVQQLRCELFEMNEELRDLKNWTEALKTRFDIIMDERKDMFQCREGKRSNNGSVLLLRFVVLAMLRCFLLYYTVSYCSVVL